MESKSEYVVGYDVDHIGIPQKCICFCWYYLQFYYLQYLIETDGNDYCTEEQYMIKVVFRTAC